MIRYLKGTILDQADQLVIVDVHDVGYAVEVTEGRMFDKGRDIEFYIYTQVREDAIRLFGFETQEELATFELLLSVSGVGPKAALAIMALDVGTILSLIATGQMADAKVKGVGKKTLEKVQVELKSKVGDLQATNGVGTTITAPIQDETTTMVYEALIQLGFKKEEIAKAIGNIDQETLHNTPVEKLIAQVLKETKR